MADSQSRASDYDCPSFSNLLKTVLGSNSSTVRFQGKYQSSQQDSVTSTKPKVTGAELEPQVDCTNHLAPATISSPHLAPVMPKPSLALHKDLPGVVVDQKSSDNNSSLSHIVMEAPATPASDGYSWRKYGQKQVKGSKSSRSYYKCTHSNCHAKKKVQRCDHSNHVIDVVYVGHHNHDLSQNKCNVSRVFVSSVKLDAGSHAIDSVQNGADMSICWEDTRQLSLHMADVEQQSASCSNGNTGFKVEKQNSNEIESNKLGVRDQERSSCGIADAEPRSRKRMKEESAYSAPPLEAAKETKIVVNAAADGGISSDVYRWRKYGQKMVKGNTLRSYYRCTSAGCPARKHVERATDDAITSTITYEGKHDHDLPVLKKQKGSESIVCSSSAATVNGATCKKTKTLSGQRISTEQVVDRERYLMNEKVLELGGEKALESAQTLLSIGIELRPC